MQEPDHAAPHEHGSDDVRVAAERLDKRVPVTLSMVDVQHEACLALAEHLAFEQGVLEAER